MVVESMVYLEERNRGCMHGNRIGMGAQNREFGGLGQLLTERNFTHQTLYQIITAEITVSGIPQGLDQKRGIENGSIIE